MRDLVHEVTDYWQQRALKVKQKIEINFRSGLPQEIKIMINYLQVALHCLCSNAVEHGDVGTIKISVNWPSSGKTLEINVWSPGPFRQADKGNLFLRVKPKYSAKQ